jgi:ABC-type sugar transport system permease subunit
VTLLEEEETTTVGPARQQRPTARRFFRRAPILFVVPAVILLLGFAVYPLFVLFRMAFSNVGPTNIVGNWDWVGISNFVTVLTTSTFLQAILRTLGITVVLLASNLIIGFLVASILSVKGRTTNVVLSIMVFVWALPPIVSGSVWKFLLDDSGTINAILNSIGLPSVHWLSSPGLALWSVGFVVAWAALPFSALILRGGLLGIPADVIEAAAIDGAGYWRTQIQIVLPLLRSTMWILAILTVLYAFKSFDFFYVLTQGGPGTSTNTLPVLSYYTAFTNFDMSTGATIAVISMLIVGLFAIPYVRSIRSETETTE